MMLKNLMTPQTKKLGKAFDMAGFEVRFVGGCVRDALLSVTPKDVDFCTDATPEEMQDIATINNFKFLPTGVQHGTVTLIVDGEPFEVTTLRVDVETDGRRAEVEFTRNFEVDAARRDLTMNAMSMDFKGNVYDYFGGAKDLMSNQVRFVGNTEDRVKEDYLRVLRYFRFAARFNSNMDQNDLDVFARPEVQEGLSGVSVERYWQEMNKLLDPSMSGRLNVLMAMETTGVLSVLGFSRFSSSDITNSDNSLASLSSLVDVGSVDKFFDLWKLSKAEETYVRAMVTSRTAATTWTLEDVKDLLTLEEFPLEPLVSLLNLNGKQSLAEFAQQYEVPVFPVMGKDLLENGMTPGPEVGKMLKKLKAVWGKSRFTLNKESLLTSFEFT